MFSGKLADMVQRSSMLIAFFSDKYIIHERHVDIAHAARCKVTFHQQPIHRKVVTLVSSYLQPSLNLKYNNRIEKWKRIFGKLELIIKSVCMYYTYLSCLQDRYSPVRSIPMRIPTTRLTREGAGGTPLTAGGAPTALPHGQTSCYPTVGSNYSGYAVGESHV